MVARAAVLVVLAIAVAAPATANASATPIGLGTTTRFGGAAGPVFAGDAVVFGRPERDGYAVVTRRGGQSSVEKVSIPGLATASRSLVFAHLEASDRRVALGLHVRVCRRGERCFGGLPTRLVGGLLTGPVGGPLKKLAGCRGARACADTSECTGSRSDVSVDAVAYSACDGVHVHDLAPGADPPEYHYYGFRGNRLGGDFLAGWRAHKIEVANWRTGDGQYTVTAENPGGLTQLSLQPDGKMAYIRRRGVAWASPAQPIHHPLPVRRPPWRIRMAGDRIAVATVRPHSGYDFELFDLGPPPEPDPEAVPFGGDHALPDMDFDGSRVAWIARPCGQAWLMIAGISEEQTPVDEGVCPFPSVVRGSAWMNGERVLRVELACPPEPSRGCGGWSNPAGNNSAPVEYHFRAGKRRTIRLRGFVRPCRTRAGWIRVRLVHVVRGDFRDHEAREPYRYGLETVLARGSTKGLPSCS